ncbi:MAG: 30S ribosomal protein S6, partial [Chloroflexi bacterium]|nr:30S ribosomal protein S6 [Chloroflexota bacterium]
MREYELVLVVSPEGGEEDFPATVDRVHGLIKERGGEVKNVDRWGRRRLAYPLDRFTEGYYSITQFTLDPQDVRGLESGIELADDVLRHLVVRMDEPIVVRPELDPDAPVQAPAETPAEGAETPPTEASAEEP